MFFSVLFKAIATSIARTAKKTNARIKAAKEKAKQGATDAKTIRDSKKPLKTQSSWVSNIVTGIIGVVESIPIVTIVMQILCILLVVVFVMMLIASIASSVSGVVVDMVTTVASEQALNFQNSYDRTFIEVIDENGIVRKIVGKSDSEDGGGDPSKPYIGGGLFQDDITLWTTITDEQLYEYLVKDNYTDAETQIYVMNMYRAIRMAYRICYAKNSSGEYFLQGIDPQVLIGLMNYEKGYDWMWMNTGNAAGITSSVWYSWQDEKGAWEGINSTGIDSSSFDIYTVANVDNCISNCFVDIYEGANLNWCDGPFSFSVCDVWYRYHPGDKTVEEAMAAAPTFEEHFNSKMDADPNLTGFLEKILQYPEYADLRAFCDAEGKLQDVSITRDDGTVYDGSAYATLLFSMMCTAMAFGSGEFYDGDRLNSNTIVGGRYLTFDNLDTDILLADDSGFNREGNEKYNPNLLEYFMYRCTGNASSEVDENVYKAYARQIAGVAQYPYHHMPYYHSAVYPLVQVKYALKSGADDTSYKANNLWKTDSSSRWHIAWALSAFLTIYNAGGSIYNYSYPVLSSAQEVGTVPGYRQKDDGSQEYIDKMMLYKEAVAGEWLYDINNTEVIDGGILAGISSGCTTYFSVRDLDAAVEDIADSANIVYKELDDTVLGTVYNYWYDRIFDADTLLSPLNTAQQSGDLYNTPNNHAMLAEGYLSLILGNDMITQCLGILLNTLPEDIVNPGGHIYEPGDIHDAVLPEYMHYEGESTYFTMSSVYAVSAENPIVYDDGKLTTAAMRGVETDVTQLPFISFKSDDSYSIYPCVDTGNSTSVLYITNGSGWYTDEYGNKGNIHEGIDISLITNYTSGTYPESFKFLQNTNYKWFNGRTYTAALNTPSSFAGASATVVSEYNSYLAYKSLYELYANNSEVSSATVFNIGTDYFNNLTSKSIETSSGAVLNMSEHRVPIVSAGCGKVLQVSCNIYGSTYGTGNPGKNETTRARIGFGNNVLVEYYVPYGKEIKAIQVRYCHLDPDMLYLWCIKYPQVFYSLMQKTVNNLGEASVLGEVTPQILDVSENDIYVQRGELLGYMGTNGSSTGDHLHFEIDNTGDYLDMGLLYSTLFALTPLESTVSGYTVYPYHVLWVQTNGDSYFRGLHTDDDTSDSMPALAAKTSNLFKALNDAFDALEDVTS